MNDRIRHYRKLAKKSQTQLAIECGYKTQSIVSMWESGARKPPVDKLPLLAKALGCTIGDLFKEDS